MNVTKPDFEKWANNLIEEYTKTNYSNCVVTVYDPKDVENALRQAFEQGYQMGFEDGDKGGWWTEQDKDIQTIDECEKLLKKCQHTSDNFCYFSNPPKKRCLDCGEFF